MKRQNVTLLSSTPSIVKARLHRLNTSSTLKKEVKQHQAKAKKTHEELLEVQKEHRQASVQSKTKSKCNKHDDNRILDDVLNSMSAQVKINWAKDHHMTFMKYLDLVDKQRKEEAEHNQPKPNAVQNLQFKI